PEVQLNGGQLIDHRNCPSGRAEVDGLDVGVASVAGLDTNVRDLRRYIYRQLFRSFLTAARAEQPPKVPLAGAERADQRSLCSIPFAAQHADLRFPAAGRTAHTAAGSMLVVGLQ